MRQRYFLWVSLVLLLLTLVGFSDNLLTDVGQPSNRDPKFIIHGLFSLAWMVLLVVQARLVQRRKLRVHRTLGVAATVVAVGVTLSTVFIFWAVWKGWPSMAAEVRANRLLLPGFALLVWLGYRHRARPAVHKRLMLMSTFFMMGPVLSRTFDPLLADPFLGGLTEAQVEAAFVPFMVVTWLGLFVSLAVFDWADARRLHPVTAGGAVGFAAIWAISLLT